MCAPRDPCQFWTISLIYACSEVADPREILRLSAQDDRAQRAPFNLHIFSLHIFYSVLSASTGFPLAARIPIHPTVIAATTLAINPPTRNRVGPNVIR